MAYRRANCRTADGKSGQDGRGLQNMAPLRLTLLEPK